jgi:hypothetical protein
MALGSQSGAYQLAINTLWGGFDVALMSHWGRIGVALADFAPIFNFQLSTFHFRPEVRAARRKVRGWMLDAGCWVLDVELAAPFQVSGFILQPSPLHAFRAPC